MGSFWFPFACKINSPQKLHKQLLFLFHFNVDKKLTKWCLSWGGWGGQTHWSAPAISCRILIPQLGTKLGCPLSLSNHCSVVGLQPNLVLFVGAFYRQMCRSGWAGFAEHFWVTQTSGLHPVWCPHRGSLACWVLHFLHFAFYASSPEHSWARLPRPLCSSVLPPCFILLEWLLVTMQRQSFRNLGGFSFFF